MSRVFNLKSNQAASIAAYLLIFILAGLFSSCSQNQEEQLLVGKWKYSGKKETVIIEFNDNNTFSGLIFDLKKEWRISGEWKLHNNVIKYIHHPSDYTAAIGRLNDEDIIVEITPNALLLKNLNSGELFPCVRY